MTTSILEGDRPVCVVIRPRALLLALLVSSVLELSIALLLAPGPAAAADDTSAQQAEPAPQQTPAEQFKEVWNRDLFTGDWEGWRTALQEHGIDPQFRFSHYGQWVADGGVETDGDYVGTMDYRVNADLKKLFGLWDGLAVNMHARTRWGGTSTRQRAPSRSRAPGR